MTLGFDLGPGRGRGGAGFRPGGPAQICSLLVEDQSHPHRDAQGYVRLTALRAMAPGDEVLISYIDQRLNVDERRQVLESHYGFSCGCTRCKADLRKKLRGGARALRAEGTGRALR